MQIANDNRGDAASFKRLLISVASNSAVVLPSEWKMGSDKSR